MEKVSKWYIGMDVGGTHIDCVAFDDSGARTESHNLRPTNLDPEVAAAICAEHFIRENHLPVKSIQKVAIGWKHGRNHQRTLRMVREFSKNKLSAEVMWDAESAFVGALPKQVGIMVLSGTGSVVYGKTSKGKILSSGGWSPLLGDPGSAFSMGQKAVVASLRAVEGAGDKTRLTEAISSHLKIKLEDIVIMADTQFADAVPKIASLAVVVCRLASEGDVVAASIREVTARELAERLESILKLWQDDGNISVSFAGRLMYAQPVFRQGVQLHLNQLGLRITWKEPEFRPPYGAILSIYPELYPMLSQAQSSLDWHH